MELKKYFLIIKKRILLLLIITLGITLLTGIASYFVIKPIYKAEISVLIGNENLAQNAKQDYSTIMMYQKQVKTYSEFAKTRAVAKDVINELNLDMTETELINSIAVTPKGDTEFLTISVKAKDPSEAKNIADQLALSLKKIALEKKKVDNVTIVDKAEYPKSADSPRPLLNITVACLLGIMVSVGMAFLLEYLDNTVKNEEEIAKLLDTSVIGVIPVVEGE